MHHRSLTINRLRVHGGVAPGRCRVAWCLVAAWMGTAGAAQAATLRVAWDPSPDPAVVGYIVSMGTESGVYTTQVDAGTQTIEQFSNLVAGTTYYFVVQAYDRAGNRSARSNEAVGVAPFNSPLSIACPVPVVTSPNGAAVAVAFSATASGGTAPVAASCSPASGSLFPVGSTAVQCTARDAVGAIVTCATNVVVIPRYRPAS